MPLPPRKLVFIIENTKLKCTSFGWTEWHVHKKFGRNCLADPKLKGGTHTHKQHGEPISLLLSRKESKLKIFHCEYIIKTYINIMYMYICVKGQRAERLGFDFRQEQICFVTTSISAPGSVGYEGYLAKRCNTPRILNVGSI